MDLGLQGKLAAVAGASSGLGFATAKALVAEGAVVAICGRDAQRIRHAADEIGPGALPLVAGVSDSEGGVDFVTQAREALGAAPSILVANSGGPPPGTFASTSIEQYKSAIEQNLLANIAMCQEVAPSMIEAGWGRIIAITSIGVKQPLDHLILSNTARAGLTGFLKTLATEVAPHGVTVNSVLPAGHATARIKQLYGDGSEILKDIPVGVLGDPEDFGAVVTFLASRYARHITGVALPVDGGTFRGLL